MSGQCCGNSNFLEFCKSRSIIWNIRTHDIIYTKIQFGLKFIHLHWYRSRLQKSKKRMQPGCRMKTTLKETNNFRTSMTISQLFFLISVLGCSRNIASSGTRFVPSSSSDSVDFSMKGYAKQNIKHIQAFKSIWTHYTELGFTETRDDDDVGMRCVCCAQEHQESTFITVRSKVETNKRS